MQVVERGLIIAVDCRVDCGKSRTQGCNLCDQPFLRCPVLILSKLQNVCDQRGILKDMVHIIRRNEHGRAGHKLHQISNVTIRDHLVRAIGPYVGRDDQILSSILPCAFISVPFSLFLSMDGRISRRVLHGSQCGPVWFHSYLGLV